MTWGLRKGKLIEVWIVVHLKQVTVHKYTKQEISFFLQGISYLLQWNHKINIENNLAVRLCVHEKIDAI